MNEIKDYITFYEMFNSVKTDNHITNLLQKDTLTQNEYNELKFFINQTEQQLSNMVNMIETFKSTMSQELFKELSTEIFSMEEALYDSQELLNSSPSMTDDMMNNLKNIQEKYEESLNNASKSISMSYTSFKTTLYYRVKNGIIPLSYLETLSKNMNLDNEQRKIIADVYNEEKILKESEQDNVNDVIDNAGQPTMEEDKREEEKETPVKDDLKSRIDNVEINYDNDESYGIAVNNERRNYDVEQYDTELAELEETKEKNGKLSFKEAIRYHYLLSSKEKLIHHEFEMGRITSIGDSLVLREGINLIKKEEKLGELNSRITPESSRIERFIVQVQKDHLEKRVKNMKKQLIEFKGIQKSLTGIKYNAVSKMIKVSSAFGAVKKAVTDVVTDVGTNFVNETKKDYEYVSGIVKRSSIPKKVASLKNKMGYLVNTDTIDYTDDLQNQVTR